MRFLGSLGIGVLCFTSFFFPLSFLIPATTPTQTAVYWLVSLYGSFMLNAHVYAWRKRRRFEKSRQKVILVDMDGVIADWDGSYDEHILNLGEQGEGIPRSHNRVSFNLFHGLTDAQKVLVTNVLESPSFYRNLEIIDGAKQALREMLKAGYDVRIVTSPWVSNPTCASDKMEWVKEHFGSQWAQRMIITTDKTLVRGDWLIDDKPDVKGSMTPTWEHIYFTQPVNVSRTDKRRISAWSHWKEVIEA